LPVKVVRLILLPFLRVVVFLRVLSGFFFMVGDYLILR
jgi:hypothetical protein